jgi:hypothetical protein
MRASLLCVGFGLAALVSTTREGSRSRASPARRSAPPPRSKRPARRPTPRRNVIRRQSARASRRTPSALTKAELKFVGDIAKADAAGTCPGTADALEAQVDDFIAALAAGIQPGPTTTTAPTTSTTSTGPSSSTTTTTVAGAAVCCNLGGVACAWLPLGTVPPPPAVRCPRRSWPRRSP